jgi:hypothetical protein
MAPLQLWHKVKQTLPLKKLANDSQSGQREDYWREGIHGYAKTLMLARKLVSK